MNKILFLAFAICIILIILYSFYINKELSHLDGGFVAYPTNMPGANPQTWIEFTTNASNYANQGGPPLIAGLWMTPPPGVPNVTLADQPVWLPQILGCDTFGGDPCPSTLATPNYGMSAPASSLATLLGLNTDQMTALINHDWTNPSYPTMGDINWANSGINPANLLGFGNDCANFAPTNPTYCSQVGMAAAVECWSSEHNIRIGIRTLPVNNCGHRKVQTEPNY